ncbi:hypothetical protein SAMN05660485_00990 [Blastococcus fimeti]|nr:hypothetical protein SAMN05660485_00990 [Blastococcus fimeti]
MSTTRSSAGERGAARLLVTLLALLLTEASFSVPRRVAATGALPGGTVAVAIGVQQSPGGTEAALPPSLSGPEAVRPFPTASLVKLFLAEGVLHRARVGLEAVGERDRDRLRAMVRSSDDDAASAVWVRFGGPGLVTDVAARYGLSGTAPPAVPGQWGRTTTTARDVAVFLSRLPVLAHPDDAAALLGWMAEVTPVAADGYDQRFGLLALPGTVAAKQGWMCCVAGMRHLHSAGVRDGRVVVLLSEVPAAIPEADARARLDTAAAALPEAALLRC